MGKKKDDLCHPYSKEVDYQKIGDLFLRDNPLSPKSIVIIKQPPKTSQQKNIINDISNTYMFIIKAPIKIQSEGHVG